MKKVLLAITVLAASITAVSALAADYSSIPVKLKLVSRAADGKRVQLGAVSGRLYDGRDGAVHLELAGREIPIRAGELGSRHGCAESDPRRSPVASIILSKDSLNEIVRVSAADPRTVAGALASAGETLRLEGGYCSHEFLQDDDDRVSTTELTDSRSGSRLQLVVTFGRSLSLISSR
jgi:hypothetical protein